MDQSEQDKQEHKRQLKLARNHRYWAKHREQIADQRKIKIECVCGQMVCRQHITEHMRTKRHQIQLESKNVIQHNTQ